jgi:hypothetical protein
MADTPSVVLLSTEVELYVQALKTFDVDEVTSKRWTSQHEMIEKLNMQAVLSASTNETEYVKDSLITYEKVTQILFIRYTIPLLNSH